MAWGIPTYLDKVDRQDLLDLIADISPEETPIVKPKKKENELWKTLQQLL